MNANLNFATGGFLHRTRFVLVNNRVPRTDRHCAHCGRIIEKGYVRDSQTRLLYCDTQCFPEGADTAMPSSKIERGKCHEMFKSSLQSRYWPSRPPLRVVQQATLLFKKLPPCLRGGCARTLTPTAERFDLLRVALFTTD